MTSPGTLEALPAARNGGNDGNHVERGTVSAVGRLAMALSAFDRDVTAAGMLAEQGGRLR